MTSLDINLLQESDRIEIYDAYPSLDSFSKSSDNKSNNDAKKDNLQERKS